MREIRTDASYLTRRTMRLRTVVALLLASLAATTLTGCRELEVLLKEVEDPANGVSTTPEAGPTGEGDYYTVLGPAQMDYEPGDAGAIAYCPLDDLERTVCAYGELTGQLREQAQARGREDITADPAGWPTDNDEVQIPALEDVPGSQPYSGWLWNRSHLVADSLGGSPDKENLVTGTRTQNVGSTQIEGQYAGGMAYTERIARDYLDSAAADECPLYYAATPQYEGDELVPRAVIVDIRSCDGDLDARVEVNNSAQGFIIDYATGEWEPANP